VEENTFLELFKLYFAKFIQKYVLISGHGYLNLNTGSIFGSGSINFWKAADWLIFRSRKLPLSKRISFLEFLPPFSIA
jgi:glutamine amidotransferase-like uncharacterized protein